MPSDQQSSQPLTASEEAFVRELSRVMLALPRAVDADIVREAGLPLSEYTPLMHLSEAPGRAMRMSELAAACNITLSGMTRVVTRLEKQGWVERTKCAEDGRGWNAALTDAGLTRLEQAWPEFLASVRRHLVDHFKGQDLNQLTVALRHVATSENQPG
ncbi:MarR family winged helix-turn-helix transcriptional regulator [Microtetraspora malaysiensis]|uniref:MarR family winged helix-turn-helix transcriptional regulator n=1 Tax=Microtetraspora malaysiensis TaxID=161358 RepID=UPI00082B3085|nr:MarR family winged helix-turn-helix transcriptional regulator [Microtetraspora malaysiensis]